MAGVGGPLRALAAGALIAALVFPRVAAAADDAEEAIEEIEAD